MNVPLTKIAIPLLSLFCMVIPIVAQENSLTSQVDSYIKYEMDKQKIPGLSLAVVKDGKLVLAKGYGLANVELDVPAKPETIFQSGSIGKQFTAAAIVMLAERGKLGLDDKVSKYLGDVPPAWSNVTIRHLLTHTSGLGGYPDGFDQRRDYTEDELLKIIESQPLTFAPGEKHEYSNTGYVTLGIIIHRVTGRFYGDFLQENIFKPLGMSTARVISEAAIVPNRAAGYILYEGRLINQPWIAPTLNRTADGSLYMTVLDLAKWDAGLYDEKLFRHATLDEMWTPVKLNDGKTYPYGFGWYISDAKGHRLIEHEGAWQGFNANIARYVDDKLTVIVMANLKSAKTQMISHGIAGIYLPAVAPPHYMPIGDKEPQVTAMITALMNGFANGTADQKLFAPNVRAAIFADTAPMYGAYLKPLADPVKVQLVERTNTPKGRLYRWEFYYKTQILLVSITLDSQGKIAAIEAADNY